MNIKQDASFKPDLVNWSNVPFSLNEHKVKPKPLFEDNPFTPDRGLRESFDHV